MDVNQPPINDGTSDGHRQQETKAFSYMPNEELKRRPMTSAVARQKQFPVGGLYFSVETKCYPEFPGSIHGKEEAKRLRSLHNQKRQQENRQFLLELLTSSKFVHSLGGCSSLCFHPNLVDLEAMAKEQIKAINELTCEGLAVQFVRRSMVNKVTLNMDEKKQQQQQKQKKLQQALKQMTKLREKESRLEQLKRQIASADAKGGVQQQELRKQIVQLKWEMVGHQQLTPEQMELLYPLQQKNNILKRLQREEHNWNIELMRRREEFGTGPLFLGLSVGKQQLQAQPGIQQQAPNLQGQWQALHQQAQQQQAQHQQRQGRQQADEGNDRQKQQLDYLGDAAKGLGIEQPALGKFAGGSSKFVVADTRYSEKSSRQIKPGLGYLKSNRWKIVGLVPEDHLEAIDMHHPYKEPEHVQQMLDEFKEMKEKKMVRKEFVEEDSVVDGRRLRVLSSARQKQSGQVIASNFRDCFVERTTTTQTLVFKAGDRIWPNDTSRRNRIAQLLLPECAQWGGVTSVLLQKTKKSRNEIVFKLKTRWETKFVELQNIVGQVSPDDRKYFEVANAYNNVISSGNELLNASWPEGGSQTEDKELLAIKIEALAFWFADFLSCC